MKFTSTYSAIPDVEGLRLDEEEAHDKHQSSNDNDKNKIRHHPAAIIVIVSSLMLLFLFVIFSSSSSPSQRNQPDSATTTTLLGKAALPWTIPHYLQVKVDHFNSYSTTYSHRYYKKDIYFKGPGHPIFLIVGGEGPNDYGVFYPYIHETLAKKFGAFVLQPEHRFYGSSSSSNDRGHITWPVQNPTNQDLIKLLTPQQAMLDMISILDHYREELGCAKDPSSQLYCPAMAVGGSYPAFLSVILRLIHSDKIDIAYASSSPLKLHANEVNQFEFYEIVTRSADLASPGCSAAVKRTFADLASTLSSSSDDDDVDFREEVAYPKLNICRDTIPDYVTTQEILFQEIVQMIADSFADRNMFNYPVSNDTTMALACHVFQDDRMDSLEKVKEFWNYLEVIPDKTLSCFNMTTQLPGGDNPRISGADWTGTGPGDVGKMWEFQCCTSFTPILGFSGMFPHREMTMDFLNKHCYERYGVHPQPWALVDEWKFNDLAGQGASRILLTNGLNDIWSAGGYLEDLSPTIKAVVMPDGAHHSELTFASEDNKDTEDVKRGKQQIEAILGGWLDDIKNERI